MLDGRNDALRVCGDCYDPPHLAERPFVPRGLEGKARFPVSPELMPPEVIDLVLTESSGVAAWADDSFEEDMFEEDFWALGGLVLEWTRPAMASVRIEQYDIWRSFDGGAAELIATNEIVYSDFGAVENEPELYSDTGAEAPGRYVFYVEGVTANNRRYRSNTIEATI